jgi:hypothetical protein
MGLSCQPQEHKIGQQKNFKMVSSKIDPI